MLLAEDSDQINPNIVNFRNSNCYKIKCNILKALAVIAASPGLRQVPHFEVMFPYLGGR
jgi:hypothetical protein